MIDMHEFVEWLVIKDGKWAGLRDEAPPEAVEAYKKVIKLLENQYDEKTGIITNY